MNSRNFVLVVCCFQHVGILLMYEECLLSNCISSVTFFRCRNVNNLKGSVLSNIDFSLQVSCLGSQSFLSTGILNFSVIWLFLVGSLTVGECVSSLGVFVPLCFPHLSDVILITLLSSDNPS